MIRFTSAMYFALVVSLLIFSTACGGSNVVSTPPSVNLSGMWKGTWASNQSPRGGNVEAVISQSGTSLSGTATVTGSPCFTSGSVSGAVSGNNVTFGVLFSGGQQALFSGTVGSGGTIISGTYAVSGGLCNGDTGSFNLTKQ